MFYLGKTSKERLVGVDPRWFQIIEDIKNQNSEKAKDVTEIKVGPASIPKRCTDT